MNLLIFHSPSRPLLRAVVVIPRVRFLSSLASNDDDEHGSVDAMKSSTIGLDLPPSTSSSSSRPMKGVGLALSGGGFRAVAVHLGAIRRLQEWGILPNVSHIAAVSGGAILAAAYGLAVKRNDGTLDDSAFLAFEREMLSMLLSGCRDDLLAVRLFVARATSGRAMLNRRYEERFFQGATLADLPSFPRIILNASCLHSDESMYFSRNYVGFLKSRACGSVAPKDSLLPPSTPLSVAVGASSAVPFLFPPVEVETAKGIKYWLVDGAISDNLAMSALFKNRAGAKEHCDVIIGSDAAEPMHVDGLKKAGKLEVASAALNVLMAHQSKHVLELLRAKVRSKEIQESIFFHSATTDVFCERYPWAFSPDLDENDLVWHAAASTRTDLDAFSLTECAALMYMGYTHMNQRLLQYGLATIEHKSSYPEAANLIRQSSRGVRRWIDVVSNVAEGRVFSAEELKAKRPAKPTDNALVKPDRRMALDYINRGIASAQKLQEMGTPLPPLKTWAEFCEHVRFLAGDVTINGKKKSSSSTNNKIEEEPKKLISHFGASKTLLSSIRAMIRRRNGE